jgi:hypothetical protein
MIGDEDEDEDDDDDEGEEEALYPRFYIFILKAR